MHDSYKDYRSHESPCATQIITHEKIANIKHEAQRYEGNPMQKNPICRIDSQIQINEQDDGCKVGDAKTPHIPIPPFFIQNNIFKYQKVNPK